MGFLFPKTRKKEDSGTLRVRWYTDIENIRFTILEGKRRKGFMGAVLPPISPSVYCRNNQTVPYSSLAHLRPRKANNDHCSRNHRIRI